MIWIGVGGSKDDDEGMSKEEQEEQEKMRQDAIRQAERERRDKYKKQEEEREGMRQTIREKVIPRHMSFLIHIKKNVTFHGLILLPV